jgi:hypothetical protein
MRAAGGLPCLGAPAEGRRPGLAAPACEPWRPKIVARIGRNYAERKFCEIEGPKPMRRTPLAVNPSPLVPLHFRQ